MASGGRALRELVDPVERRLDRLEQQRLDDGQRRLRHGDRDVARIGAERRLGGQADGAGHPRRAADDEDGACRVLRVASLPARDEPEDLLRDEPVLRVALVEPDVRDLDLACVEASRRDDEPDLAARASSP